MKMDTVNSIILTHRGYSIPKSRVGPKETEMMQLDLTVCPKVNSKYMTAKAQAELTYKLYRESSTRWYLPRSYGIKTFGQVESTTISDGLDLSLNAADFKGSPYQYQTDIINSFVNAGANGLICVPCGKGKTFMAVKIAATLKKRFLVIVDKEFLMNQWRGEMASLLPGLRVGIIQGPKAETDPDQFDCTICMIQTLCGRDFDDTVFKNYGFAIFDECHHLGAQHFSKTLQKVQVKHMLGLSATPKREDGLTKVFFWFLGEPVYWEKTREPDPTVVVRSVMIHSTDTVYNTVPTNWRGEIVTARLLGNIIGLASRTEEIVRWVLVLCENKERKVLVLSERIGHLEEIERLLKASGQDSIAYYVGGMKEAVREEGASKARVLLASYAMASEAMNIKTLNTVILASPRKNVEQSTGRILRTRVSERSVEPMIVDIVDSHAMYRSQWKKRCTYYRKCKYTMEIWGQGSETAEKVEKSSKKGKEEKDKEEEEETEEKDFTECLLD